jgi:hypothetical protein
MDLTDAGASAPVAPAPCRIEDMRQRSRAVDNQKRLAADTDIAGVSQILCNIGDERQIVLRRVPLTDQNFGFGAIPAPGPVLIGPADAERQIKIGVVRILLQRQFQYSPARKPIKIETECADTVELCEFDLATLNIGNTEIVKAEFTRQPRL